MALLSYSDSRCIPAIFFLLMAIGAHAQPDISQYKKLPGDVAATHQRVNGIAESTYKLTWVNYTSYGCNFSADFPIKPKEAPFDNDNGKGYVTQASYLDHNFFVRVWDTGLQNGPASVDDIVKGLENEAKKAMDIHATEPLTEQGVDGKMVKGYIGMVAFNLVAFIHKGRAYQVIVSNFGGNNLDDQLVEVFLKGFKLLQQ